MRQFFQKMGHTLSMFLTNIILMKLQGVSSMTTYGFTNLGHFKISQNTVVKRIPSISLLKCAVTCQQNVIDRCQSFNYNKVRVNVHSYVVR